MELEAQQLGRSTRCRGVAADAQPAPTVNATPPMPSPRRLRLTGIYLKLKVQAQGQGIEIETAALRAFEAGQLTAEDYEMVRAVLRGDVGQATG